MMKNTFLLFLMLLVAPSQAASLSVDFNGNNWGSVIVETQTGFEAYNARNEVEADFVSRIYSAFGTTITVTPTWAPGVVEAAMQSWWRDNAYGYSTDPADMLDLVIDWIGTDQREVGDPMTLTMSGLPAGTYDWLSYHHDMQNQTGHFSVMVNDAAGSAITTGLQVSSSQSLSDLTLADVTKFETEIVSDGANPVALVFEATDTPNYNTMFIMNGFEISSDDFEDPNTTGTVHFNGTRQQFDGFGGAAVYSTTSLVSHAQRETIYDLLFKELGIDILRIRNTYGYPDSGSALSATGTIVAEARDPQRSPDLRLELVPWSPAAYLKDNGSINGGTLAGGPDNYVYTDYADWWADSLTDVIDGWPSVGIYPDFISIQNEPDWETSYDSCRFDPTENSSYPGYDVAFEAVYNELYSRMGTSMPKMWAPCTIGANQARNYIDALVNRGLVDLVDGFVHHLYGDGDYNNPDSLISSMQNFGVNYGYKPLHMDEYVGNGVPTFEMGLNFAWHIYNALYYEGVTTFFNWSLFRSGAIDESGGIITLTTSSDYVIRPQYWFLKGYTHFTDPGWYVLNTALGGPDASALRMAAFKSPDDSQLTIVILNVTDTSTDLTLTLNDFTPGNSVVYRSSATENWVYQGAYNPSLTLPAESITTIYLLDTIDTEPPAPNPAAFSAAPAALSHTDITMTATDSSDASDPVEYYFACTAGGGNDSGWQTSATYTDRGLSANTRYTYTVTMRDSMPIPNVGAASAPLSASTFATAGWFQENGGILSMEAEHGTLGNHWIMGADAGASNDAYIEVDPVYDNPTSAPECTTVECIVSYDFNISISSNYKFWFRTYSNNANDDSFFWRIDSGSWVLENNRSGIGSWFSTDHTQVNSLSTGSHVLEIAYRENGTRLDKFVIQLDSLTAPSGDGPAESSQNFDDQITNCLQVQLLGYRLKEDLNGDCHIGMVDLILLTDQWLSASPVAVPPNYSPDLVANNEINLADFAEMADQWLACNDPETTGCIMNW